MNIVFWQNCVSPHQIPYIKEICKDSRVRKVSLVVPRIDYSERKEMGWDNNDILFGTDIEFYLSPDYNTVAALLGNSSSTSFHFFSGIRADADVYRWFCQSCDYNVKRGIITEPPNTYNRPLWMHYIRFFFQDRKYISKIDYVFGFGDEAVTYYRLWSKKWKVIPFIYCTESKSRSGIIKDDKLLRLIYVGSLSKRKNVIVLLKAMSMLSPKSQIQLDIIGGGDERKNLEIFANKHDLLSNVTFLGALPMKDVSEQLSNYDILILPSLYDGWGAVVNEAIALGLYTICSDKCGARLLLKDNESGLIFRNNQPHDLKKQIQYCDQNKSFIKGGVRNRIKWAANIEGRAVATYFIENLLSVFQIQEPWR